MKQIKFNFSHSILALATVAFMMVACDRNKEDEVDKTALQTAITSATTLIETTTEGTAEGQYMPGSKAVLQEVIDAAQTVYDNETATQVEVDNAVIAVNAAVTAYGTKIVEAIAPEALVGHWTFDDGSGTTLTDFSGNGFDGTLADGTGTWGGDLPQWTTDRYGNSGGALAFNLGSHVVIPYNAALNPAQISISLWINAAEVLENNRFMGLHSWLGYKFQLQSANKAFFTVSATDAIYDKDTDPPLEVGTWYHIVVTFGDGNTVFYVNGTQTISYETAGTATLNSGNDLVFGQDSDEYAADDSNYDNDHIIPLSWGGYFHGSLDEVRMYNTVLTPAQVASIYNVEKVQE
ncbi:MAG: LamG-like jellyroll fold domain-containing protein [Bacteroidota bacterium]